MINAPVKPWIQTYSGKKFDFLDIKLESIDIIDIAHALSNLCRYTGHTKSFYSVADHSILAALNVNKEDRLVALLHDATEAYLNDISKPLKNLLPRYRELEDAVWLKIAEKFGLPAKLPLSVKDVDLRLLATEKRDLLAEEPDEWTIIKDVKPYPKKVCSWGREKSEELFLKIFYDDVAENTPFFKR